MNDTETLIGIFRQTDMMLIGFGFTKFKGTKWNIKRPLLDGKDNQKKINKLYAQRKNIYKLSKYKINCNNLNKENIAKKIIAFHEKQ